MRDAIHSDVAGATHADIAASIVANGNQDVIAAPSGSDRIYIHGLTLLSDSTGVMQLRSGTTPITGVLSWLIGVEMRLRFSRVPYFRLGAAEPFNILNGPTATRKLQGFVIYSVHP